MNREEFKKLAEEEFINNTMKHLDSALIFTYIQNLEQKEDNLQSKIDKATEYLVNNIDLENDDFTKMDLGCNVLKILDLDKYNEFLKEDK